MVQCLRPAITVAPELSTPCKGRVPGRNVVTYVDVSHLVLHVIKCNNRRVVDLFNSKRIRMGICNRITVIIT